MAALDFENFVAVEQVQIVQLAPFTLELVPARFQRPSERFETVHVVLHWQVTLAAVHSTHSRPCNL